MIKAEKEHPILIQGAVDSEISVLLAALQEEKAETVYGFPFHIGRIKKAPVIVMKNFMGMVNASAATLTAIQIFHPACVINQGICGGHTKDLRRGDFLISRDVINPTAVKLGPDADGVLLSGAKDNGTECIGACGLAHPEQMHMLYRSDPELMQAAREAYHLFAKAERDLFPGDSFPQLHEGRMSSCDLWIDRPDVMEAVRRRFNTSAEDMESAAAAQICASFGVPFLSVRTPSNSLPRNEAYLEETSFPLQRMIILLCSLLG